jgi:hypothetical protein
LERGDPAEGSRWFVSATSRRFAFRAVLISTKGNIVTGLFPFQVDDAVTEMRLLFPIQRSISSLGYGSYLERKMNVFSQETERYHDMQEIMIIERRLSYRIVFGEGKSSSTWVLSPQSLCAKYCGDI